jgi:hypothetical protein
MVSRFYLDFMCFCSVAPMKRLSANSDGLPGRTTFFQQLIEAVDLRVQEEEDHTRGGGEAPTSIDKGGGTCKRAS